MIRIDSEIQLREAFRTIDRDQVQLPRDLSFPLILKDYIAWTESSGHRTFLLFQDPRGHGARGIVFKRAGGSAGDGIVQMCQWCHAVSGGNSVRLLTAQVSSKRRVGVYICASLDCKEKVLGLPGVNDLREPYSRYEKLYRVLLKMSDFLASNLESNPKMALH